jgi:hypothetical protein
VLKEYIANNFRVARRSAWNAANGIAGGAIGGVGLIWPGILPLTEKTAWWSEPINWLGSFLGYALFAWGILLILSFFFIAPYKTWSSERTNNSEDQLRQARIERQIVKHDRKIARRIRELMSESQMQDLIWNLKAQHAYSNPQGTRLSEILHFIDSAEAHLLEPTVRGAVDKFKSSGSTLLLFLGDRFFVYPNNQTREPLRYAMQPGWNMDREGDGSEEQQDQYAVLTKELEEKVDDAEHTYREMIKSFHSQLFA